MSRTGWILLFLLLVLIIVIVVLIIVFDVIRHNGGQTGQTGQTGMTGQTGITGMTGSGPCGNATVFDQLCLLNGVVITLSNNVTGGLMGICQGDVLNSGGNPPDWCVGTGTLNFVSTSPNMTNSTSWQVLRSTNNQFIAFLNTATNEYLSTNQFWTSCFPCTFGFGCNNPVSTHETSLDPNNPSLNGFSWFTINIVDLGSGTIQLLPSNKIGYVGSDSSQMNSNSCSDMVAANYPVSNPATNWVINYLS